jgi:steroid delta-isomerase-like uncharacterized protein
MLHMIASLLQASKERAMDARVDTRLSPKDMDRLIERHITAEMAGDSAGAVSVYTDDVEHDVVGAPHGPLHGRDAARGFYDHLIQDIHTETMIPTRRYYGDDFCVQEHQWTGTVPGSFLGVPGGGKRISFRLLHLWEFRDGRISRENVWLDGGSIVAQLTQAR